MLTLLTHFDQSEIYKDNICGLFLELCIRGEIPLKNETNPCENKDDNVNMSPVIMESSLAIQLIFRTSKCL